MKKFIMFATVVAITLEVAMPTQAQTLKEKKAAKKAQWELEQKRKAEEDALRYEMHMDSLRRAKQANEDAAAHEKEMRDMKRENERDKAESKYGMEKKLEGGVRLIYTPCMDEFLALNKVRGQMAAQGISSGQPTQESAELNANRVGLMDLTSRFMGVIKNGVEQYTKDTSVPHTRDIKAELEGMATAFGEKAINELYVVDCRQFGKDRYNQYVCYEAIYVPVEEVLNAIINETVKRLDIDKARFRKSMQEELDANAARENTSLMQQLEEE